MSNRLAQLLLGSGLLVLSTGCTTLGPDFKAPELRAPAQWSELHGGGAELAAPATALAALPADRWAVFADPELSRLLALASQANADVKTAALHLLQSRADELTASAQRGIQAGARGAVSRQEQSRLGGGSRLVSAIGGANKEALLDVLSAPFTLYQAGFDASWEPDLWGRVLRSVELAQANTEGQRALLRQVRWSISADVARAYFALRSAQRQTRLVQDGLAAAQQAETLLEAQHRHGLADESALLRQRSQRAGLHAQLPIWLAQEAQAINRITLLCGAEPGWMNDSLRAAHLGQDTAALPDLRLGLPADLIRRRPDVAAAEAHLHAATAGIGIAMADLYPRITLGASFGIESVGSSKFGEWSSRQWSVGPSLNIPVWDQGRRRATITLRELQQQEAAVAFQQAVLKAWHEVDDAVAAYLAESQRELDFAARVRLGHDDAQLAQARYRQGLTNYLPVLSSRTALIEAERDRSDSAGRLRTALVAVYKALGDDGTEP